MQTDRKIQNKTVQRIVRRNFKKNRLQNTILILAVILVTVLMTVMFGTGISMVNNVQLANERIQGTLANGFLWEASRNEMEEADTLDEVSEVGYQQYVAEALVAEQMGNNNLIAMTAYDEVEWEQHILPTISGLEGKYPENENEVMISEWSLEKLGVKEPEIGMAVTIEFQTLSGEIYQQEFTLSGYYEDYIYNPGTTPNSGNTMAANLYYSNNGSSRRAVGNIVVSDQFAQKYGNESEILGTCHIGGGLNADEALAKLKEVTGRSDFIVAGLNSSLAQSISVAAIPMIAVILILLSGWLLIYNIGNITVIQEMHMYGQLKTLGTTEKQIKGMVRKRSNMVSVIGIPIGLILGNIIAILAVPTLIGSMLMGNGYGRAFSTDIVISPFIYILAAVFTYMTVRLSNRKPAKLAAKVSPVEALKYIEHTEKVKAHKSANGGKLYRMAFRNVFRSKKRAMVTLASLFFGVLIYFIICSNLFHINYEARYQREIPDNFIVQNLTFETEDQNTIQDLLNEEVVKEISEWDGVDRVDLDYVQYTKFENAGETLKPYLTEQAQYRGIEEQGVLEDFQVMLAGLTNEELSHFTYHTTLSEEEVEQKLADGTGVLLPEISTDSLSDICGEEIMLSGENGEEVPYTVLGLLYYENKSYENAFNGYGSDYGYMTKVYTTKEGVSRLNPEPVVQTLRIQSESEMDEQIQDHLAELFADTDAVLINSQLEAKNFLDSGLSMIQMAGVVLGGFLIFMGILNFINVIFTNVYSRQKELAALESIGMTQAQIRKTLILEGVYYSFITILLLLTLGTVISYLMSMLIQNVIYYLKFSFPIVQLAVILVIMLIICVMTPVIAYQSIAKESVVERLRKGQD